MVVTGQVWVTLHRDNEGELRSGVKHIFFEDQRHITKQSELVAFLVGGEEEWYLLSISPRWISRERIPIDLGETRELW